MKFVIILEKVFREKHYQKAIELVFTKENIKYVSQCPYKVRYKERIIGRYFMDLLVENKIVIEIKRGDYFSKNNIDQIYNYLKAINLKLGILVNFTSKGLRYKRILNIT